MQYLQILMCIYVKVEEHYLLETSGTVSCSGVVLASSWIIHWWRCRYLPSSRVTGVQNGRIMWCPGQSQMLWNCVAATRRLAPGKVKLFSEWRAASQLHMRMRHLMCQLQLQSLVHSQCGIVTRRQIFTLYTRAVNQASQCPEKASYV